MYEPKGTHLIDVNLHDAEQAGLTVIRLAHRLGREDVDVTWIEAYASDVTGTYLHHSGGTRRMAFKVAMCQHEGHTPNTCQVDYREHIIRVWEDGYGRWKLADNTNKKVGLKK